MPGKKKRQAQSLEERLRAVRESSDAGRHETRAPTARPPDADVDTAAPPPFEAVDPEPDGLPVQLAGAPAAGPAALAPVAAVAAEAIPLEPPATAPVAFEPPAAAPVAFAHVAAVPTGPEPLVPLPSAREPVAREHAQEQVREHAQEQVREHAQEQVREVPPIDDPSAESVLAQVARLSAASEGDTLLPLDASDAGMSAAGRRAAPPSMLAVDPSRGGPQLELGATQLEYAGQARTRSAGSARGASARSEVVVAPVEPDVSHHEAGTSSVEPENARPEPVTTPVGADATRIEREPQPIEPAPRLDFSSALDARDNAPVGPVTVRTPDPDPRDDERPARRLPRLAGLGRRRSGDHPRGKGAAADEPAAVASTTPDDADRWERRRKRSAQFGRIGTTMIERGLITNEQLDTALEVQRSTGRRVGEILVGMGLLSRFELARVLADHMGVPFTDLRAKPPDPVLALLLPEEVARRYRSLVIDRWNGQLVIAMANPADLFALDDLQLVMGQPMITAMAVEEDIVAAIDRVYRVSEVATTLDAATTDYVSTHEDAIAERVEEVDEGPVVRLVNALMEQAIRDHASDLHVEPSSNRIAIRFRIDGVLHDSSEVPLRLLRPLVSRLKILASLDIAQNRIAQDGRFSVTVEGRPVDVRVVTVPTAAGESVILRLLDPTRDALDLSSLGLNAAEEARFVPPFFASQGAAFITGPTGSGKTSTVYTLLSEVNTRSKSIVSVEDPVEYRLDGIKQIQANPRVGLTFATTLPSILRSDPDIVFIGEVRDAETARIAADASITGHLVLSTLHATRAAAAPMRLVEMGVEPYLVASALTLVAAQRLARKLCDRCAMPVEAAQLETARRLSSDDTIFAGATIRQAVGCPACRNSGYSGRLPIFEIMPVTESISRLILDRAPRAEIERVAVDEGMETMRTAALRRVAAGRLSVEEMMRIIS